MKLDKTFDVHCSRDDAVEIAARDDTVVGLFPDSKTEIVESSADRKTTRTRYTALGRQGVATFHFDLLMDGNIRFEKVCDGKVWKELRGEVTFDEAGDGTRVCIRMEGATKSFVPEFTIRGPMQDQIEEMGEALRERLEAGA
jgi:hypothetical protein